MVDDRRHTVDDGRQMVDDSDHETRTLGAGFGGRSRDRVIMSGELVDLRHQLTSSRHITDTVYPHVSTPPLFHTPSPTDTTECPTAAWAGQAPSPRVQPRHHRGPHPTFPKTPEARWDRWDGLRTATSSNPSPPAHGKHHPLPDHPPDATHSLTRISTQLMNVASHLRRPPSQRSL